MVPEHQPTSIQVASPPMIYAPCCLALLADLRDVLELLAERDPDVIGAVADVDRSLIWDASDEDPFLRLDRSARNAAYLAQLASKL